VAPEMLQHQAQGLLTVANPIGHEVKLAASLLHFLWACPTSVDGGNCDSRCQSFLSGKDELVLSWPMSLACFSAGPTRGCHSVLSLDG
jgi:hypothetical protein